jgi:hypothetical protein
MPRNSTMDESLPVEVTGHGGKRFPVAKVAKGFVYMVNENVPNPLGTTTTVGERNSGIGYTQSGAGRVDLIQEAGVRVYLINGVPTNDGESFGEESVHFVPVFDSIRVLVDGDGEVVVVRRIVGRIRNRNLW